MECLLAIDQGTTSSRAIVFDRTAQIVAVAQEEFPQIYPANGWVEHDPEAIWATTQDVCRRAAASAAARGGRIVAAGVTNQRETAVIWDRETGRPIYNAIVWQDRRTAGDCETLKAAGAEPDVAARTGLVLDPYFSASKIAWILDHVEGARTRARDGRLAFGTIDAFLIWRLTGGRVHATDATNASRTSLYNIVEGRWDDALLEMFRVPLEILPEVRDCTAEFGRIDGGIVDGSPPILGVAGDQQAAAVGQACFEAGDIKSTYGTGCFVLMNTGETLVRSGNRLLSTIAARIDGRTTYALEGSIFTAGAGVQWLRDKLGVIRHAADTEGLARSVGADHGVYIVPAFTGLGAPHWDAQARGAVFGLTRATGPAELARAMIEAVCFQTRDLLDAMAEDGVRPQSLKVDGGMVANEWMCEFLAGVLDLPVSRPEVLETTALGAAYLAGMKAGLFGGPDEIRREWREARRYAPRLDAATRGRLVSGWRRAVAATRAFATA